MSEPVWNFFDPASKEALLGALRHEIDDTFVLAGGSSRWHAPTACAGWEVRDIVGHLVDTTEGYLPAFEMARGGGTAPEPLGLRVMAKTVDEGAKQFRKVPQDEMLDRLHDDAAQMMGVFEGLAVDDWGDLMVPHKYMGPLPAMFYTVFQLVDYAVHNWDIRQGIGEPHALRGDSADFLAPVIPILWQATADVSSVTEPFSVGVRLSGRNGGDTRFDVSSAGVQFAPGDIEDCDAILEFDPATLVLTAYGRMHGGTARGDRDAACRFLNLFFPI